MDEQTAPTSKANLVPFFVIAGFCVLVGIMVFVAKDNTLERIPRLEGEKVIFSEDDVHVSQVGSKRPTNFPNCRIEVTEQRILIGQKTLLGKEHALRYIVRYKNPEKGKNSLHSSYLELTMNGKEIRVEEVKGEKVLVIPLSAISLAGQQDAHIYSKRIDEIRKFIH